MAQIMEWLTQLSFTSDAERLAFVGVAFWLLAAFCLVMERLRNNSRSFERLEKVGFMPWTMLFLASAFIGGGFLVVSLPIVIGNL